jgi:ribonuclease HI
MSHALLTIHTDGASRGNPGPAAFAYTISQHDEELFAEADRIGRATNNRAEYTALVEALKHALELGSRHCILVNSDSELMVKQMKGEYRVKNEDLRDLYEEARDLCDRFEGGVNFLHVRREQNRRADELANEALDGKRQATPRAANTPRAAPKLAAPSPRDEGVACLRRAAAAWKSGAAAPTPEHVWEQLVALLKRHGASSPPGGR